MLDTLKKILFNRHLTRRLKLKEKAGSVSFSAADRIAIVYDSRDPKVIEEINRLKARIKAEGKTLKTLAFIEKIEDTVHITCPVYSIQQIDWIGLPDSREVEKIIEFKADLLILINTRKSPHANYILALSRAKIKAGIAQNNKFDRYYNLLIDSDELKDRDLSYTQIYDIFSKLGLKNDK